jgi:hypothetical protein
MLDCHVQRVLTTHAVRLFWLKCDLYLLKAVVLSS